jgi:alkyl sulfatase BDS1-like metallo-beta-lactamase superfamily hydrolase
MAEEIESAHLQVIMENPEILDVIVAGGSFGGEYNPAVAANMFSRQPEAVDGAREQTRAEQVADRTWMIYMPIVNSVVFETDEGLVVVDTGMAPAGPALRDTLARISDKPIHTIIYTHSHVDHAFGTWALIEDGSTPEIVAHVDATARVERYARTWGTIARLMSQPIEHRPTSDGTTYVKPTRVFRDTLALEIGGETFDLIHRRGETEDQLYVSVPGRKAVCAADYYQPFIPNAGNGKRVQRYPEEWAGALREMIALEPDLLLPAHGMALTGPVEIAEKIAIHAEFLEIIVEHTMAGLEAGIRQDLIVDSLEIPDRLLSDPTLTEQYNSPKDISKMVIRQYVGWWDEIPSHWSRAPLAAQGAEIVRLAGGIDALLQRIGQLLDEDLVMACHLVDWGYLAEPENPDVLKMTIEVYKQRMIASTNTQEALAYLEQMVIARKGLP